MRPIPRTSRTAPSATLTADREGGDDGDDGLELDFVSSVVRLGKLASADRLKVRSYLVVDGQLRSLKVWFGEVAVATGRRGLRRYRTSHKLALGVAQTLSWAPAARERAVRAGRADRFDAEHLQRVRWLTRWLDG